MVRSTHGRCLNYSCCATKQASPSAFSSIQIPSLSPQSRPHSPTTSLDEILPTNRRSPRFQDIDWPTVSYGSMKFRCESRGFRPSVALGRLPVCELVEGLKHRSSRGCVRSWARIVYRSRCRKTIFDRNPIIHKLRLNSALPTLSIASCGHPEFPRMIFPPWPGLNKGK